MSDGGHRHARPPASIAFDLDGYRQQWQRLHHADDTDPSNGLVGRYTAVMYRLGAPLARRRVAPMTITGCGLLGAVGALALNLIGRRWALGAAILLLLSALCDGLDGAVAVLSARSTRLGAVVDSVADRLSDAALIGAIAVFGVAPTVPTAAFATTMLLEYTRARALVAGQRGIGVITVAERPTRLIIGIGASAAAGIVPSHAEAVATTSLWVLVAITAVGLLQLWWWLIFGWPERHIAADG